MKILSLISIAKSGSALGAVAAGTLALTACTAESVNVEATDSEGRTKTECLKLDTKLKLDCLREVQESQIAEKEETLKEKQKEADKEGEKLGERVSDNSD